MSEPNAEYGAVPLKNLYITIHVEVEEGTDQGDAVDEVMDLVGNAPFDYIVTVISAACGHFWPTQIDRSGADS